MTKWLGHPWEKLFRQWVLNQPNYSLDIKSIEALDYWLNSEVEQIEENFLVLTLWNTPYPVTYQLMQMLRAFVADHPSKTVLIFTSHERCFTYGRGLQKIKNSDIVLTPFEPKQFVSQFPLYEVERGGGLTFHYPGQLVCYPITQLRGEGRGLKWLTYFLLGTLQKTLRKVYNLENVNHESEMLGLWVHKKKLASIGISLRRMVSAHGLAANVNNDVAFFEELASLNPCGLSASTYTVLESEIKSADLVSPDQLKKQWLPIIIEEWYE